MAKLIKKGVLRKRDNILRDWHPYKLALFGNGILQLFYGRHLDEFENEYHLNTVHQMYFSQKDGQSLVLIHNDLLFGWKLKFKASKGDLLQWVAVFMKFTKQIPNEQTLFWSNQLQQLHATQVNEHYLEDAYKKLIDIPDGTQSSIDHKLPDMKRVTALMRQVDACMVVIEEHKVNDLHKLIKAIKTFVMSYIARYLQLFRTESDMNVLRAMMDILQLGYEIEVLQRNDLNEDEKLDRMIKCLDAVVMTGIQKS
eukprot:746268_1